VPGKSGPAVTPDDLPAPGEQGVAAVSYPRELQHLLEAGSDPEKDTAWSGFLAAFHRLLLHTARTVLRNEDDARDAYAEVLERLRASDFARLRNFTDDGRTQFTTWLVVVTRRLCVDSYRRRYGRATAGETSAGQKVRHALHDERRGVLDPAALASSAEPADVVLEERERLEALERAVGGLEPRDRMLLALRFKEEQTAIAIARLMGFPTPFHVYRRLNTVLGTLRRTLGHAGVDGLVG